MRLSVLVPLCAAALGVAAEDTSPLNDIRVGVSILLPPTVQERITAPGGTGASYEWDGFKRFNLRYEAMYLQGMSRRGRGVGGFTWGVGALYGDTNITPDTYNTGNGISTSNSRSDLTLHYKQYGIALAAGYASAPSVSDLGAVTWELLPIVRTGLAKADSVTPGFTTEKQSGSAYFWESGLRGGVSLADGGWILGLHLGWVYGKSKIDIGMGAVGDSQLLIVRNGPEAGLELGARF